MRTSSGRSSAPTSSREPTEAFDRITLALQQYQKEDTSFRSFSSQYDEFLRGRAALSAQQVRGLSLFNDPRKGNCAGCHPSAKGADGSFPLFTDFTYDNLGVPRNPALARNADPGYFDLGLCERADLAERIDCAVPSRCLRCATSRCARPTSTTAASRR